MNLFKIFGTIAVNNTEANNSIDDTADRAGSASSVMQSAFKKIGSAVVTYLAVDKIREFGTEIVNCSAEVSAEQSAFAQIMGDYSKQAQEKLKAVADATGMLDSRLTPYMTSMTAKFKGLGYGIDDSTSLAQRGLMLAGDAAAFWDKSLEESMGGLNSFINGSYEGGEAIGLFANDTQLASYAVKQGIVSETKEWANLDEARKQATRLQYAEDMYKMSGATGQAAKEADQYANVQANLTEKWRQFKAQIGEPVLQNLVIPAMDKLSGIVDIASKKFEQAQPYIQIFGEKVLAVRDKAVELGDYARDTFAPVIERMGDAFNKGKEMVQPFVDALGDYIGSGEAAADVTNLVKDAIDAAAGIVTGLLDGVEGIAQGFQNMYTWGQQNVGILTTIGIAMGGLTTAVLAYNGAKIAKKVLDIAETVQIYGLIAAETAHTAVTTIATGATTAFGAAVAFLTSPITIVIAIITALVAAGVLLYRNWDVVKEKCLELGQKLSEIWENIKSFLSSVMENIKATITNIWNGIKDIISSVLDTIRTIFSNIWNAIKSIVQMYWNYYKSIIETAINVIKTVINTGFNNVKVIIDTVLNVIKTVIQTAWNTIKGIVSAVLSLMRGDVSGAWNAIKSTIDGVLNGIRSIVSSVWNGIKNLTSNTFNGIKSVASSVWNGIKSAIEKPINAAKDAVKSAIDKMKSFFNFSWSLPKLKLPHISISGKFSLDPPSVPHFGIEWYKKAMDNPMVLDSPTIFGYNPAAGKFLGAGEAGTEVVAGADTLKTMIREAVAAEQGGNTEKLIELLETLLSWLSNGGLHTVLTEVLTKDIKLKWEGRELARLVRTYA